MKNYGIIKILGVIFILFTFSGVLKADIVTTSEKLEARISYVSGVAFDFSYYKDRYDLELRHHENLSAENPILEEAKKRADLWEKNYLNMIQDISVDKITLIDQDKMEVFKFKCRTLSGSKLIALFIYVRITSRSDLKSLVEYFTNLEKKMKNSDKKWERDLVESWNANTIPIPTLSNDKSFHWISMTPSNYIKNLLTE